MWAVLGEGMQEPAHPHDMRTPLCQPVPGSPASAADEEV